MPTKIPWATETWSPITGCTPVSPGCANCYAAKMAKRLRGRFGYPQDEPFRVTFHPDRLDQPLRWQKPRRIFVVSMGDLFHEDVSRDWLTKVFQTICYAEQHTFLALTKRPLWMIDFLHYAQGGLPFQAPVWPLPNLWLGTSVENQATADERIPYLLRCPAAVRYVSYEPALGPVDIRRWTEVGLECSVCSWRGHEGLTKQHDFPDEEGGWVCPKCGEPCAHTPIDE